MMFQVIGTTICIEAETEYEALERYYREERMMGRNDVNTNLTVKKLKGRVIIGIPLLDGGIPEAVKDIGDIMNMGHINLSNQF